MVTTVFLSSEAPPISKQLPALLKVFKLDSRKKPCKFVLQFGILGKGPYSAPSVEYRPE